jgi:hypothetical protein
MVSLRGQPLFPLFQQLHYRLCLQRLRESEKPGFPTQTLSNHSFLLEQSQMSKRSLIVSSKPMCYAGCVKLTVLKKQLQDSHPCLPAKNVFKVQVTHLFSKKCLREPCLHSENSFGNRGECGKWVTIFPGKTRLANSELALALNA